MFECRGTRSQPNESDELMKELHLDGDEKERRDKAGKGDREEGERYKILITIMIGSMEMMIMTSRL